MFEQRRQSTPIAIIGAGMSGICCAAQLKLAGFDQFVIIEKSAEAGGTWLENSYPNAGCDIPSHLYSFSFAPKFDWTQKYARQPEILDYFLDCVERFGIRPHIRFESEAKTAVYDEQSHRWQIDLADGSRLDTGLLISAVGQLNRPHIPNINGLEEFRGASWHSARWNHDVDLKGRRVAIIGNGASTVQFLPEVARQADQVFLFQRSANYILPLHNYRYPRLVQRAFQSFPSLARLHRLWLFLRSELRTIFFRRGSWLNRKAGHWIRRTMKPKIKKDARPELMPEYAPGCKRILQSSDYLESLSRDNVKLISAPITRLSKHSVHAGGKIYQVDAVVFGTGFRSHGFMQPMSVCGRGGRSLEEQWRQRPKTLLGMSTAGFPNLFFLFGPNTSLGHNSIIYMVESQVRYLVQCLDHMRRNGMDEIEVSQAAVERFDQELQRRLEQTVWAEGCTSWYKTESGSIPNNWYGSALSYRQRTMRPNYADFLFRSRAETRRRERHSSRAA